MARTQAGLMFKRREAAENPLRTYTGMRLGRVVNTHPEHGTVDVALLRGPVLHGIPVTAALGGTRAGTQALPQIWNSDVAYPKTTDSGEKQLYDEGKATFVHDTFAVVNYIDGYANRPVVTGFMNPNYHENSFHEPNLSVTRQASDVMTVQWSEGGIDVRPPPFGDGDAAGDGRVDQGNWQMVFPDRERDIAVPQRAVKFGSDRQTYLSVGYHDRPRAFGDGTQDGSANFDNDKVPFQINPNERGNDTKHQKFARALVLNQRWRSRLAIDQQGNLDLHAEGLGFDSTSYEERTLSYGNVQLWARLNRTDWQKHSGGWTRMRPRYDGGAPEDVPTAKRTGTHQLRVQRLWDVAVRKDARLTARDSFSLNIGDFPTHWNDGDLGVDPGTRWDDNLGPDEKPSLNPEFKQSVGDDVTWAGDDFQDSGSFSIHQNRRLKAKATGALTASWLMDPAKPGTDTSWTHTQRPQQGGVTRSDLLVPSAGKPGLASTHIDGDTAQIHLDLATAPNLATSTLATTGPNPVTLTITSDASKGLVHITANGPHPVSFDMNALTGQITLTALVVDIEGTLKVNGTTVTVP